MLAFPTEKKWLMVSQDKQADGPVAATASTAAVATATAASSEKNTPEFYIKQFLEPDMRGVTPRMVAHLAVSLRTMPLR